jgi:hypothetical protein
MWSNFPEIALVLVASAVFLQKQRKVDSRTTGNSNVLVQPERMWQLGLQIGFPARGGLKFLWRLSSETTLSHSSRASTLASDWSIREPSSAVSCIDLRGMLHLINEGGYIANLCAPYHSQLEFASGCIAVKREKG